LNPPRSRRRQARSVPAVGHRGSPGSRRAERGWSPVRTPGGHRVRLGDR